MNSHNKKVFSVLFFVSILWGFNFVAGKIAMEEVHPFVLALIRITVAGVLFFPIIIYYLKSKQIQVKRLLVLSIQTIPIAFLGIVLNQYLFLSGLNLTTPAHSSLIMCISPVFVFILSSIFLKERIKFINAIGIIIATIGIVILNTKKGLHFDKSFLKGDLLVLLSSFAFACFVVLSKRVTENYGPWLMISLIYVMALPFASGISHPFFRVSDILHLKAITYLSIMYVSIFSSVIAYSLYMWALSKIEAVKVSAFTYLQPVFATLFSLLLALEYFSINLLIGGIAIFLGLHLSTK